MPESIVMQTSGSQVTSSDHTQRRFPSAPPSAAVTFTTRSRSGNSHRCGDSASRSFGPMSGSVLISSNARPITSRNSSADLNPLTPQDNLNESRAALHQVLVDLLLNGLADALRQLEHKRAVGRRLGSVLSGLDRV